MTTSPMCLIVTLSIMTLSPIGLIVTLSINDTQNIIFASKLRACLI
jgi:hypothetical protein